MLSNLQSDVRAIMKMLLLCLGIVLFFAGVTPAQQLVPDRASNYLEAESLVIELRAQLKEIKEPAIRVFLGIQLASFLWGDGGNSILSSSSIAREVALRALSDLKENRAEIPPSYAELCRNDLMALFKLRAPSLYEELDRQAEKAGSDRNPIRVASELLDSGASNSSAIDVVTQSLSSGVVPGDSLVFFLFRLQEKSPKDMPRVLQAILLIEERKPGTIDFYTFSAMRSFFLKDEVPPSLKSRFLAAIISGAETAQARWEQGEVSFAYQLLVQTRPAISTLAPQLASRSEILISSLRSRLDQLALERIDIDQRIRQGDDLLSQLMLEADAAKHDSLRRELRRRAAQAAFDKGQFKLAVDLEASASDDGNISDWRDQFLGDIVVRSIKDKDLEIAEYAAGKMRSPLNKAKAKQKMALYWHENQNMVQARESLNEAASLILSSNNSYDKAKLLLSIAVTFRKIDELRVLEIATAAVDVINRLPQPGLEEKPGSKVYNDYIEEIAQIAWVIIPVFKSLTEMDEIGIYSLAKGIHLRELRVPATFGVYKVKIMAAGKKAANKN